MHTPKVRAIRHFLISKLKFIIATSLKTLVKQFSCSWSMLLWTGSCDATSNIGVEYIWLFTVFLFFSFTSQYTFSSTPTSFFKGSVAPHNFFSSTKLDSQSTSVLFSHFALPKYNFSFHYEHRKKKFVGNFFMLLLIWWWCKKKSSLLNNILLSCKQQKNCSFWQCIRVCTLFFFHHTNSPVYMHFFLSFFSRKVSLSSLFTPSFIQYWHYVQRQLVVVSFFFVMCIRRTKKKELFTHKKKRANIFLSCTSSVFWITDIFSNHHPMQYRRVLGWLGDRLALFVVAQRPSASRVLCVF